MIAHSIVVNHNPQALLENIQVRHALENVAITKLSQQSPLRPDEAEVVIKLVRSGELFKDLLFTLIRIIKLVINEFNNIENIPQIIPELINIPVAVVTDLLNAQEFVNNLGRYIYKIKNGDFPKNWSLLNNTLKAIFQIVIIAKVIDTANNLFNKDNKSLRISLLIYARLHKINLEDKDIDVIRNDLLNKENPQLGALILYVLDNANRLSGQ